MPGAGEPWEELEYRELLAIFPLDGGDEHRPGRPMLSSIVWYKDMSSPGPGLYKLGVELGIVRGNEDGLAFAIRQVNETHAFLSAA